MVDLMGDGGNPSSILLFGFSFLCICQVAKLWLWFRWRRKDLHSCEAGGTSFWECALKKLWTRANLQGGRSYYIFNRNLSFVCYIQLNLFHSFLLNKSTFHRIFYCLPQLPHLPIKAALNQVTQANDLPFEYNLWIEKKIFGYKTTLTTFECDILFLKAYLRGINSFCLFGHNMITAFFWTSKRSAHILYLTITTRI